MTDGLTHSERAALFEMLGRVVDALDSACEQIAGIATAGDQIAEKLESIDTHLVELVDREKVMV